VNAAPKVRIGLFLKFLFLISLLIVFTSGTLSYFLIRHQIDQIEHELEDRGIAITRALARESEYGVLIESKGALQENLSSVLKEEDVIYALVYDERGRVMAAVEGNIGIPVPPALKGSIEVAAVATVSSLVQFYRTEIFDEPIYDIAFPIRSVVEERKREEISFPPEAGSYQKKVGVVRVGLSLVRMNNAITNLTNLSYSITGGVILVGILVAILLLGIITRPLRLLVLGIRRVASGDLNPVKVSTADEIGELTGEFNSMVEELARYRKGAEGYRKTLEYKISERTKEVHEWKSYSENILATMAEGLVAVSEDGVIEMANRASRALTGYSEEELIGQRLVPRLFPGRDREKAIQAMDEARGRGILKQLDLILDAKDGREIPINFNAAVLRDEDGKEQGMVIILHDMTKEKEVDKMKSEFISTVTHELRTPLTSIEGFISLILARKVGDIQPKQEEFLNIVKTQSKHLKKLIQSLLDFSRIASGKVEIERKPTSIKDMINEVMGGMRPQIAEKGIDLDVTIDPDLPQVFGDDEKIGMAFANILGNSIKFTGKKGKIKVAAEKRDSDVLVSVSDTGVGIEKNKIEKVFDRFYQIDSSLTRKAGGAGIGLAIAKEVVEAHKGRIWVESEGEGRGSKFSFTIPIGK
jgi:PAS domain S-box-containing protein